MNSKKLELYTGIINDSFEKYLSRGFKTEVDAHIHTTFSDGTFDILDIIVMAKLIGLKKIVITDHNTILPGYNYLNSINNIFLPNISIQIGSEIACKILDDKTQKYIPIEILAYNVNPFKLQNFIDKYPFSKNESQEKQLKSLMNMCDKYGLIYSKDITVEKEKFATEVLCLELLKHKENTEFFMRTHPIVLSAPKLFFKKYCANPSSEFYLDTTSGLPTYIDTINAIIEAGGTPILAHPFIYIYENFEEVEKLMDKVLNTSNIAGFEAYHSSHTIEQRNFIISYAKKNGKVISGGTDFHSGPQTILGFGREEVPFNLRIDMFPWLK